METPGAVILTSVDGEDKAAELVERVRGTVAAQAAQPVLTRRQVIVFFPAVSNSTAESIRSLGATFVGNEADLISAVSAAASDQQNRGQ